MRHVPGPGVNGANDTQSDASHGEKHSCDGLCRVEEGSVGVDVRRNGGEKSKWSKDAAVAFPSAFEIKIKTSAKVLFHPDLLSTKVGHIHIFQQLSCLPVAVTSQ